MKHEKQIIKRIMSVVVDSQRRLNKMNKVINLLHNLHPKDKKEIKHLIKDKRKIRFCSSKFIVKKDLCVLL